ncbi:unnamed protein product [Prunus armeniaca]
MDVTFIEDEMFFFDTLEHVIHKETCRGESAKPATPVKLATLAEPVVLTDVTALIEPIAPVASQIVPDRAIPENRMDGIKISTRVEEAL